MRVLATIPELAGPSTGLNGPAPEATTRALEAATEGPPIEPRAAGRRRLRRASKPGFPFVSAAALAVITAVIWSLVASREAGKPGPRRPDVRLAAEPAVGSQTARAVR